MIALEFIYLVLFGVFLLLSLLYIRKTESVTLCIILLILTGFFATMFIREMTYPTEQFVSTDEADYLAKYYECQYSPNCIVSGEGYLNLYSLFYYIFPELLQNNIPYFTVFISCLYLPLLFILFQKLLKNVPLSFLATISLLVSSYFVLPMVVGRPEQIGLLLLPFFAYFMYFMYFELSLAKRVGFLVLILSFLFYLHVLTFLLALVISVSIILNRHIQDNKWRTDIFILLGLGFILILLFTSGLSAYAGQSGAVKSAFSKIPGFMGSFLSSFYPYPLLFMYLFCAEALILLLPWLEKIKVYFMKLFSYLQTKSSFLVTVTVVYIVFFALFTQFTSNSQTYTTTYSTITDFILFQVGNILFGLTFLYLILKSNPSKSKELSFLKLCSMTILALGLISVPFSLIFPDNFENWLVRCLQYFTVFGLPLTITYLYSKFKKEFMLYLIIVLLILPSLLLVSRDPLIFDSKVTWDSTDYISMSWLKDVARTGESYTLIVPNKTNLEISYGSLYKLVSYSSGQEYSKISLFFNTNTYHLDKIFSSSNIVIYGGANEN